jgi:H+/Cl- antiporter ClcA
VTVRRGIGGDEGRGRRLLSLARSKGAQHAAAATDSAATIEGAPRAPGAGQVTGQPDPVAIAASSNYVRLLVLAAVLGAPIAAFSYFFLALVSHLQTWVFTDLPHGLGFDSEPTWWPLLPLTLAGVIVAVAISYLPGRGGHSPADGLKAGGGPPDAVTLPGIALAALAGLALGAVIGPEAPLIALGAGLAAGAVRLLRRDTPAQALGIVAAAGSFAAISTLLGSPLVAAFLMMEASGLGGAMMGLVLLPGLLAAGIGYLIFIGLDSLTGLGTFTLAIPDLPTLGRPEGSEFGWALLIGLAAAVLAWIVRWLALALRPHVERRILVLTPVVGLAVAGLAIAYAEATGKGSSDVLFSGQSGLPTLVSHSAQYSVGALLMLLLCKGLAYALSLSSFRGGPIFPAIFLGAAGGMALSHVGGLPLVAGVGMGIGAMTCGMLGLPLVSVVLASVLMASAGVDLVPLVIVAVAVAYVARAWLIPALPTAPEPASRGRGEPAPHP